MQRGDIYLITLNPTAGHEQQGIRPVLIVTVKAFNDLTQTPIVLPITSKGNFARTQGFVVALDDRTKTQGVIRTDQPRAIDIHARAGKKLEHVPQDIMDDVLAKLATLIA